MIGGPQTPADRLERFRTWLEAFTGALERGDLGALDRAFAVQCSWQPGPFAPALRGRGAIRRHVGAWLVERPGLATRAEVLGVGATYGNRQVWQFAAGWQGDRSTEAVKEMGIDFALFDSIEWWRLVPDLRGAFLVSGQGADVTSGTENGGFADVLESNRATAAISGDGKLAVVYVPTARTFAGVAAADSIEFRRDGVTESIRATNGDATGMKWLAGKANCLTIKRGEGYCRD